MDKKTRLGEIIKLRLEGLSAIQVKDRLEVDDISDSTFYSNYYEAGEKIRDIQENEVLSTRVLHAQRYELLYEWFFENDFDREAIKMLENVERLLGLHSNSVNLSIHNLFQKKTGKANIYNYKNLSEVEMSRLQFLVEKAKK
jgi:hypothetical protein